MVSYHVRGELDGAPVDLSWASARIGPLTALSPSVRCSTSGRTEISLWIDAESARQAAEAGARVIEAVFRSPLATIEVRTAGAA